MKKWVFLLLALPTLAAAQMVMGPPLQMMMTSGYVYSSAAASLSQDVLREDRDRRAAVRNRTTAPVSLDVTVSGAAVRRVARELAEAFPSAYRSDAATMYEALFKLYEENYPNTIAGALATLAAGSYGAYHNEVVPDAHSLAVLRQFETAIRDDPRALQALTAEERRESYVQMIMLGMQLMAATINGQNGSDAEQRASLRAAGQRNLEEVFKVPAGQIRLGRDGLALR